LALMAVEVRSHPPPADDRAPDDAGGRYVPALDGLRALAVVAAMLFHAGALRGGFLGVDLFFVVSGFLITGLLLEDAAGHGKVRLGRFWARRARRLAPALLLLLAAVLVWARFWASPAMAQTTTTQAGWSLAYLANWFALFGDVGYWGADAAKTPLNHLWSLAIEEQFYVVWPLAVAGLLALSRHRRVISAAASAGIVVSGSWQWWAAEHAGTDRAYLGTDTRAMALFVGCLLAVVLSAPAATSAASQDLPGSRRWDVAVVAAAGWLGWSWMVADLGQTALYRGWLQGCSIAAGVLVAAAVVGQGRWYGRALSSPPLVWVGKRSYSLYLWHWPIWVLLSPDVVGRSGAVLWAVRVAVTAIVSAASYSWVEQPIRSGAVPGRRLLVAGGAAVAGLAAAVLAFPPTLPPEMGDEPVTLGGQGGLEILVVGDSWARNMGFAMARADPEQRNTYVNQGVGGCGLLAGLEEGCFDRQREAWRGVVARSRPDAVVLVTGTVDQGLGARIDGRLTLPCDPGWDAAFARRLDEAIDVLEGSEPPGATRIPVYVTTVRDAPVRPQGSACVNRLLTEGAERNGARVLDLHAELCPDGRCLTRRGGEPLYDDTQHLGPAGQRWIGGWILDALQRDVTPTPSSGPSGLCRSRPGEGTSLPVASYASIPDGAYPDSFGAPELTDGRRGRPDIADPAWQGWRAASADIVVTLRTTEQVCSVTATWLQALGAGVQPPTLVEVYVSTAPGELGQLLAATSPGQVSKANEAAAVRISADDPLSGRFITLRVRAVAEWTFVDEISAHGPPT
jgi:peptidoglycan/LPS O-acetylase OafA/YrhL